MPGCVRGIKHVATAAALAGLLGACSSAGSSHINDQTKFSSSQYGVAASPRVTRSTNVPRGGGRYMVGQPYKVAGNWYRPRENRAYDQTGLASWYGPNFQGRVTANGEVFDQNFLSAAHPTLPLPSYVRVQNLANGRSLVVRVNDRGPFTRSRLIDLSRRAAEVLGYIDQGTARVRVTYVGPAPVEGDDTRYLVASINAPAGALVPPSGSGRGGPSIISRQGGGLFGALANLFSYAGPAGPAGGETVVNEAHAAANAMAARVPQLAEWRKSVEENVTGTAVDLDLGTYPDAAVAADIARRFALLGAVEQRLVSVEGILSTRLVMTYLKPGATGEDVAAIGAKLELGLGQIAAYNQSR